MNYNNIKTLINSIQRAEIMFILSDEGSFDFDNFLAEVNLPISRDYESFLRTKRNGEEEFELNLYNSLFFLNFN